MSGAANVTPRHADARVDRLVRYYESLQPAGLDALAEVYTPDAFFKDPFNEVRGLPAIRAIFEHMFTALQQPRFVVRDVVAEGDQCFMSWDFLFIAPGMGPQTQTIRGATQLRFATDGRASFHRDYWDAAEELYEKLPVVGALMRWLKRRARS